MEVQNNTEGNQKKWTLDATTDDNESASATTELFNGVAGPPSFMFEETKDSSKTSSSTPPRNPTKAGILIHGKQGGGSSKLDSEAGVISDAATSDGRKYHEVHEVTTGREMQLEASGDPHHQRKVSWGNDIHLGGGIPSFVQPLAASEPNLSPPLPSSSSIARRIYSEDFSTGLGSPMLSHLHQPELGSLTPTYSNDRSSVIVNLNDVLKVNPLESEAETLVLQAIERQHVTSNQEIRAGSSIRSSNLFVNIPAESVDVFSLPSVEPNVNDTESSAAKNHPRRGYVDGSVTVKTVPQAIPKPSTTRNTTMEQTLSSLTRAMASFHRGDGRDNDSTSWKGGLKAARGAGQVLVQNANLVLRVKPKSKASEDASNKFTTTAESSGEMDRLVQNESDTSGNKAAKWWCFRRHAVALTGSQNALKGHEQKAENSVVDTAAIQDDVERGTPETNESNESRCGADNNKQGRRKCCPSRKSLLEAKGLTREVKDFQIFVSQLRGPVMGYVRCFLLVTCPAMATALILFYCTGEPCGALLTFVQRTMCLHFFFPIRCRQPKNW